MVRLSILCSEKSTKVAYKSAPCDVTLTSAAFQPGYRCVSRSRGNPL
jgi:hypothetical protein